MAEAEQAIIQVLKDAAPVTALVSNRIYFRQSPQTPGLPFIVLWRVSAPRIHSLNSTSGLVSARLQLDIYATTAAQARAVGAAVRTALDGLRDLVVGVSLQGCMLLDEMDGFEAEPEYQRLTQDYRVWYQE